MKKLGLIFTVISIFLSCQEDAYICKDPRQIDLSSVCDSNYNPVCGCDGLTYFNSCQAELKAGLLDWTDGECKQECEYNDTVLVFAAGSPCILLQNSSSELYEIVEGPSDFTWELGEYYLINHSPKDTGAICMIGSPIKIECALHFNLNSNCKSLTSISGTDDQLPDDSLHIEGLNLFNDCIEITYSYLGGCDPSRIHLYHLVDSSDFLSTRLQIRYDNGDGPCTEPFTDSDYFDLSSLQLPDQASINIQIDCNGDENFYEEFTYQY